MQKIVVGVLRGGPSSEYDISLKTGENVLKHLPQHAYKPVDVFLSKSGQWHWKGLPVHPEKVFRHIDVAFNALHGEYGEDGMVQRLLHTHNIPYTGSAVLASHLAMHKPAARKILAAHGLHVPPSEVVKQNDDLLSAAHRIARTIAPPWVVKPSSKGSSVGVSIAKNIYELVEAETRAFAHDSSILVEKYIKGREAICAVLENFRNEKYYTLPVVEIVPPPGKHFFDYECKYDGTTKEICPGRFDLRTTRYIQSTAQIAHEALGCRHYSRTDMIIDKQNTIWVLEVNTLPGLTSESLMPKSAEAIGCSFPQLLDHIVKLALKSNDKLNYLQTTK